jgi:hypothetical protein
MEATNLTPEFHYKSLETRRSIRLLKFCNYQKPGDIACSISHVLLDGQQPPYIALSYVWGIAPDKIDIFVDGARLRIPRSAAQTLFCLRLCFSRSKQSIDAPPFWIESICINQASQDEKVTQIPLMEDIYSQASLVISNLSSDDLTVNRLLLEILFTGSDRRYSRDLVRERFRDQGMYK